MSDFLPQLLFLAVGGAIAPPLLLLTILFLRSQRALPNTVALALGYFATCAAIGIAGLALFDGAESAASTVGRVIGVTVGALLIVLGLRNLLNAPDPDAQPPRWMESVKSMSPPRAFGIGVALFPLQVKNLAIFVACIELIIASRLSFQGQAVALVLVLVIFAIPVLVLIGLYASVPQRASDVLGSLRRWMEKNNRIITVVLCFLFGTFSYSEASRDHKTMRTLPIPEIGAFATVIPKTKVSVVAPLASVNRSLLSRARGKRAWRDISSRAIRCSRVSHTPGGYDG